MLENEYINDVLYKERKLSKNMSRGILAVNSKGNITLCTAKTPGHGNCNHLIHMQSNETENQFYERVDKVNQVLAAVEEPLSEYRRINSTKQALLPDFDRLEISKEFVDENHDILAKHPNSAIRALVAHYGYNLEELSNDSANHVRRTMARDGHYTDKFLHDTDTYTREEAIKYLKRSGELDKNEIRNLREKSKERKNIKDSVWKFNSLVDNLYSINRLSDENFNKLRNVSDMGSEIMHEINNNKDKTEFMNKTTSFYNMLRYSENITPQEKAHIRDNCIATLKTYIETCKSNYKGEYYSYNEECPRAVYSLYVQGHSYLDNEKRYKIYNDIPEEYLNILKSEDYMIGNGRYDFVEAPKQN